ncbi:MAG: hypothetical protein PUC61_08855 [Bacteroidales bacterium]|nr:hypothetical protein [Bacteroidales bacterium]
MLKHRPQNTFYGTCLSTEALGSAPVDKHPLQDGLWAGWLSIKIILLIIDIIAEMTADRFSAIQRWK